MKPAQRALVMFAALGGLAACGQPASAPPAPPKAENPGPPLIPNPMPPGYVGRWAASADQCAASGWVFTDKGLTTPGEVSCAFSQVTPNESGWIAEGVCTVQSTSKPASLVLNTTRTGQGRTLALSGAPFPAPQVLIGCDAPGIPPAAGAAALEPGSASLAEADAIDGRTSPAPDARLKAFEFKQGALAAKGWREANEVVRILEAAHGEAGRTVPERSYYFRAGETGPFLVRDAGAAYVFEAGKLAAVFDRDGAQLQPKTPADKDAIETRILTRARTLRAAAIG